MSTHIFPITAGVPNALLDPFGQAVGAANARDGRLLSGFAYATLGGVRDFVSHLEGRPPWKPISKQFVIGIHNGITEPAALELLRTLNRSEVRVFIPNGTLNRQALVATPLFHPKVFAVTSVKTGKVTFLQAGSANLTSSALANVPRNYEFSIGLSADGSSSIDSHSSFGKWWSRLWIHSRVVNKSLIERYADLRLKVLEQNPILRHAAGPPSEIQTAKHFFVEVGAGSGPPGFRHQVEFPESLAAFFGEPERHKRTLRLSRKGVLWHDRPLSYKVTTFDVEIWRLGMPTQNSGGDPIAERAIRFTRTVDPDAFEFEIADTDSSKYAGWENSANLFGHLGATQGLRARNYGFY